jgi:L-serine dehydratase
MAAALPALVRGFIGLAMVSSVFDIFKIGVGPSSSHTMGPMSAAADFADRVLGAGLGNSVSRVAATLYGSLALTGKGHATDRAILLGLAGERPETSDPDHASQLVAQIRATGRLPFGGRIEIAFDEASDLIFKQRERLDFHSNAMRFDAFDTAGALLLDRTAYSIGGGAVLDQEETARNALPEGGLDAPHRFSSGDELLERVAANGGTIADLMRANEEATMMPEAVSERLAAIRQAMSDCIDRGMATSGILPGGLNVKRRAPDIHAKLIARQERALSDPLSVIDWVNLWALAVNEENAAGGRVVTAPTNGAAGIVPAVLRFYDRFVPTACVNGAEDFLLTAAAIGSLFKENASISGAEVGCQGEIGVACSMAAAGLAAALGATPQQIENAAEIGMEHNLGLTCDPVGGLVQVPCIERNAVGSIKAIEAARLAMLGDGTHRVSLDQVIETMRKTGLDMSERYKETSLGGLAVNVVAC